MAIIDNRYRHHPFMFQSSREEMAMETEFSTTLSPPRAACTGDHVLNVQKCEGCFYWKLYSEPECKEIFSQQNIHYQYISREVGWTDGEKVATF